VNTAEEVHAACRVLAACYTRGWISTRDGNVSVRDDGGSGFFISPSGAVKHSLSDVDFIHVVGPKSEESCGSQSKASGELELHRRLQGRLPQSVTCVLHVHATHVVAAMYAGIDLRELALQFPEVARYTRVGPQVPALAATSDELAIATEQAFFDGAAQVPHIIGLAQHGVVSVGRGAQEAFEHVERLNHICEIALLASASREAKTLESLSSLSSANA